ncbi:MAG: hypothetical protein PHE29_07095, partial [Tissierellia bacterium]|nr:hypothetical protein [Tissierellia bacterium]
AFGNKELNICNYRFFSLCSFLIIYRKCFLCIINHKRGASRIYSLLTLLGLEDRICTDSEIDFTILNKKIDYDSVHEKLNELKIDSLHFLESALRITS